MILPKDVEPFGFEVVRTERRWFSTQDEAATWITSQILAA